MNKLTNKTIIKSISYDQIEILSNIISLYCPEGFHIDCTYSKGNFYTKPIFVPQPKIKLDLYPQQRGVIQADSRNLPFQNESIRSIVFDPPFTVGTGPSLSLKKKGSNIIATRFGRYASIKKLWEMYSTSLKEFYRVLNPNGILVFKCQDTIDSSKQYLSHVYVINQASRIGLYPIDLFILLAKTVIIGKTNKCRQLHCRKFHSYFLVFKKEISKIKYIGE